MKRLIGVIQFMTRIPIGVDIGFDKEFHKGMIYFPIVGFILGLCYYLIALVGLNVFNPYLATILVLVGEVLLTGGLHLDGLGDTFDGLYSYRDKERILEIMKDSRLGTNGLLAIMLVLMLKAGFIYELIDYHLIWPLILMPAVARTMQVWACYKTKTPREKGMGNIFIGKVSTKRLLGSTALLMGNGLGIIYFFEGGYIPFLLGFIINIVGLIILNKLFVRSVYQKIDGITGDILGCICELGELMYLLLFYVIYYYLY